MSNDLAHWVRACRGRRVLLIGDLILDRYVYGDAERISPEAPVPVLRVVENREAVGGCANVASCLTALGCEVVCCGILGRDRHGEALRNLLIRSGVDCGGVLELPDRPTTSKTRFVGLAQHRHRQQLLRLDEEDSTPLSTRDRERLTSEARDRVATVEVVCVEDYDKGVVTSPLTEAVIAESRRRRVPVLVDPARLREYGRYRGATIVTPNRDELSIVAGRTFSSLEDLAAAAVKVKDEFGIDSVVATVDRDGAVVVEKSSVWRHLPTTPRSVYDNTGAGDAVLAMLSAATAAGADLVSAARLANIAGGLEVEKFGCVPIPADEVLAELRLQERQDGGKQCTLDELSAELQLRRDRGETVALTNGCFDVLHAGHVDFLKRCRKEASLLVVGLNSDASVRKLEKGDGRPVNKFEHRAQMLSAMECVDYVVGFDEPDPEALLRRVRPDVLIKGEDWANKGVKGREIVESYGGHVVLLPLVEGLSTTRLIERIKKAT